MKIDENWLARATDLKDRSLAPTGPDSPPGRGGRESIVFYRSSWLGRAVHKLAPSPISQRSPGRAQPTLKLALTSDARDRGDARDAPESMKIDENR